MTRKELVAQIKLKKSFLCIGLDTDLDKVPPKFLKEKDPIFSFNKAVIDATHDLCVAYKPNIAFYEAHGIKGWESLQKTIEYIPKDIFTIADAKRGDIGNTSRYYAKAFLKEMDFDSITIAPYMGSDSVKPFLEFEGKWGILLALTSNQGAYDFQFIENQKSESLFEQVLKTSKSWGSDENLMYVVGATRAEDIDRVRKIVPNHFFLVPGVGAQGGSLDDVVKFGWNDDCGLLVNSSRGIIYASRESDFKDRIREKAKEVQNQMARIIDEKF